MSDEEKIFSSLTEASEDEFNILSKLHPSAVNKGPATPQPGAAKTAATGSIAEDRTKSIVADIAKELKDQGVEVSG